MENENNLRIITLKDFWEVFLRHIVIIILAALVSAGALFAYNYHTFTPLYKSTATLYILKQMDENTNNNIQSDFSLALSVVNDCTYLLKSHAVLDDVIEDLNLSMSYETLSNSISTFNPENTRILEVTVKTGDAATSKLIVDSVCKIGSERIMSVMGFNQVNPFEYGTIEKTPCNSTGFVIYIVVGLAAAIIVYAIFLIVFMLDDRIKGEDDVIKYLGLSVLSEIPNCNDTDKKHRGYYYYSSKSHKYQRYQKYEHKESAEDTNNAEVEGGESDGK